MIRVIYWFMALIELLILLGTILLFVLSDSKTIDIVAKDILSKYNISYKKISGNIFTGIELSNLEYNSSNLIDNINIYWNPISLLDKKIHITKINIDKINSNNILSMINSLPKSKGSKYKIPFSYQIDSIDITTKPLNYHGVVFKNFELNIDKFSMDSNMKKIKTKLLQFYMESDLLNIGLHGKISNNNINLNRVSLTNIDTKAITKFIKNFNKNKKNSNKKVSNKSYKLPFKSIKIDKLLASIKEKTNYGSITLKKIQLIVNSIVIDIQSSYNINSSKAILIAKTNFADTKQEGYIRDSKLYTNGNIITKDYLFRKYHLPFNKKELKKLYAKLELDYQGMKIDIDNSVKKLLVLKNDFNIDIKRATHKLSYIFKDKKIYIHSKIKASMNYSDESDIDNIVLIDIAKKGYTTYQGSVNIKKIKLIPQNISKNLLENLKLKYKGNKKELLVDINSNQIKGEFLTQGYKSANLKLFTKKSQPISKILTNISKEFKGSFIDIKSNSFIDFKNITNTKIKLDINSDIANIYSTLSMKKPLKIIFETIIPPNSKISKLDKRIKLKSISKIDGYFILDKKNINHIFIKGKDWKLSCDYNSKTDRLNRGSLDIADNIIKFGGGFNSNININTYIQNLNRFTKAVNKYYNIKIPKIDGKVDINIKINSNNKTNISLKSKNLLYGSLRGDIDAKIDIDKNRQIYIDFATKELNIDTKGKQPIVFHKLSAKLSIIGNQIVIDRYSFRFYNEYISHFFSTKKSYLVYDNNIIYAKKVWLRDNILVKGNFNINKMIGDMDIVSNNFHFKNSDFDLLSRFNLNLKIDKNKLFLKGLVELLGNKINYKVIGSGISEDSDIIILENKSQQTSTMLNNLKLNVQIKNKIPLKYKTDNIDIDFSNDVTIIKDYYKDFKLLGTTTINRGYYKQDNKKFFLGESYIYFSGNPKKPMLDIKAIYNKEQYSIQIFISGSPQDPIINFNSDPYLTQEQILSLILFDSTGENSGSGTELYALLGGTFAKELMKSLGISVDHLVLGQGVDDQLSVEVGQKISKNITIIYLHNNGKDGVKIKVDHNKHFETDILMQPQSSSIEFLYKSD